MKNERFEKMPEGFRHWNQQTGKFEYVCDCCGLHFDAKKASGVKFCSATCRKRSSTGHREWNTACHCVRCGRWFSTPQPFQHPEYCSNACRQAAYRERKARRVTPSSHI